MEDDERQEEMDCIAAIFPEISFDPKDRFTATIGLPINPSNPVKVVFPASSDGTIATGLPTPPLLEARNPPNVDSHDLSYLPSVTVRITLPVGYPAEKPAKFELSTNPAWLSREHLDQLEQGGEQMWEEAGRSEIVYGFIDSLQQAAENAFGFAENGKVLEASPELKISLLDYDIKARKEAFDKETFDCGICLDPKKGSVCHKMNDCGHVFCVQCLQDFYNNAITEGDLATVRCLDPGCAKERRATLGRKKAKIQLGPSELLQIPLEHEMVTRYVKLKHKAELESDKNTIYCPRKWCQGAARSNKHRKPNGLEDTESEDEQDEENTNSKGFKSGKDLLSVCEDCSFAFCSRCYQGWHGEFQVCVPQTATGELTEEDKKSLEYLKLHSTSCPTCASRAQKTHGCNHMICFKCNSHFCYLCSAWLEEGNPYKHFNVEGTYCYMRLWELEDGDGDDDDRFNDRIARDRAMQLARQEDVENEEPAENAPIPDAALNPPNPEVEAPPAPELEPAGPPPPALQREGPLVLRINQLPARPAPPAPAAAEGPLRLHRPNRNPQNRQAPPGRRPPRRNNPNAGHPQRGGEAGFEPQLDNEAARRAWVQMFVQMALNDEEDQVEWDEDDEVQAGWEIPVGR